MTGYIEIIILIVVFIGILLAEAYLIDLYFWGRNQSDKPWSEFIYAFLSISTVAIASYPFWQGVILILACRVWFDPMLNRSRKDPICYHPDKNWYERFWRQFSCIGELLIRVLIFIVGIVVNVKL